MEGPGRSLSLTAGVLWQKPAIDEILRARDAARRHESFPEGSSVPNDEQVQEPEPTSSLHRRAFVRYLPLILAAFCGIPVGLGVFTFGYGQGYAYLGNDPKGCANCHVMQDNYDSWLKSSHHSVAVCNDCHAPHDSLFGKYLTKADNGFFHSLAFTTGDFQDPIQIKERNSRITQSTCIDCHKDLVNHLLPTEKGGDMMKCVHCHMEVGHSHSVAPRRYEGY
jgi:cytochrome c nitrite reductase small subunit